MRWITQPGWIGTTDALPLFLTQRAAIWLDGAWFFTTFEKNIQSLAEGTYGAGAEDATEEPASPAMPAASRNAKT